MTRILRILADQIRVHRHNPRHLRSILVKYCKAASAPDEQPVQLVAKTRRPLPCAPGQPERYDYEYERAGTADVFMFTQPLGGWRRVRVRA